MAEASIEERVRALEREIAELRGAFTHRADKRPVSIRGLMKGVKVSEEDIREAKRSLFPHVR